MTQILHIAQQKTVRIRALEKKPIDLTIRYVSPLAEEFLVQNEVSRVTDRFFGLSSFVVLLEVL